MTEVDSKAYTLATSLRMSKLIYDIYAFSKITTYRSDYSMEIIFTKCFIFRQPESDVFEASWIFAVRLKG